MGSGVVPTAERIAVLPHASYGWKENRDRFAYGSGPIPGSTNKPHCSACSYTHRFIPSTSRHLEFPDNKACYVSASFQDSDLDEFWNHENCCSWSMRRSCDNILVPRHKTACWDLCVQSKVGFQRISTKASNFSRLFPGFRGCGHGNICPQVGQGETLLKIPPPPFCL